MVTMTETCADYSLIVGAPTTTCYAPELKAVYKCDLFGDGISLVCYYYDRNKVPSWFRRLCTTLVIGTKWTKL